MSASLTVGCVDPWRRACWTGASEGAAVWGGGVAATRTLVKDVLFEANPVTVLWQPRKFAAAR